MTEEIARANGAAGWQHWHDLVEALTDPALDEPAHDVLRSVADSACAILRCRHAAISVQADDGARRWFPAGGSAELLDRLASAGVEESDALRVPLQAGQQAVGELVLLEPGDRDVFGWEDRQAAQLIAAAAAAAVRRMRIAAAYAQRHRWLAASAELTRELLGHTVDNPLQLMVDRLLDVADAQLVAVLTEFPERAELEVVASAGSSAGRVRGRVIEMSGTYAAEVLADGIPRVVSALTTSGRHATLAQLVGADTAVLAALGGPPVGRGVLAVFRRPDQPAFGDVDVEACTTFAAQMTVALQLADSRERVQRAAVLDDRDRIARDLHDHVIQRLFAVGLTVQGVGADLYGEAAQRLLHAVDEIDATIGQIRATIYRLTEPIVAPDSSLRTRVVRLVDEMEPVLGLRADLEVRGPVDFGLDPEVIDDCMAVLREALTNVARHAEAGQVDVLVQLSAALLTLEVIDDGRGVGEAARRSGLANLYHRAERRGGRLRLASAPSRGTRLSWTIPIGDPPA